MTTRIGRVAGKLRHRLHHHDAYLAFLDWRADRGRYRATRAAATSRGGTELHRAVADFDVAGAAALLARGADVRSADEAGFTPLARGFARPELVHAIRQRYQLTPWPDFAADTSSAIELAPALGELRERGIVKLPGFVVPGALERLRNDFAGFVAQLDERVAKGEGLLRHYHEEEHFWPHDGAYITNNAFKHSEQLAVSACHDALLAMARRYFAKPVHVQRAVGMGYLPGGRTGNDMFIWHHDVEGRRLKLMILLTEITGRDHTMSYVAGSHRIDHPWHRFQQNRLSLSYCARRLDRVDVIETTGVPGDAYVFDSNGVHMGNRRATARRREVFMVEYNSDPSNIYGGDVPSAALEQIGPDASAALALLRGVEPRWKRAPASVPTWVATLYDAELWLGRPRRRP